MFELSIEAVKVSKTGVSTVAEIERAEFEALDDALERFEQAGRWPVGAGVPGRVLEEGARAYAKVTDSESGETVVDDFLNI